MAIYFDDEMIDNVNNQHVIGQSLGRKERQSERSDRQTDRPPWWCAQDHFDLRQEGQLLAFNNNKEVEKREPKRRREPKKIIKIKICSLAHSVFYYITIQLNII